MGDRPTYPRRPTDGRADEQGRVKGGLKTKALTLSTPTDICRLAALLPLDGRPSSAVVKEILTLKLVYSVEIGCDGSKLDWLKLDGLKQDCQPISCVDVVLLWV